MATIPFDIIRQAQSDVGGTPSPRTYPEASSQTFVKGELVYLSGGYLTEIGGDTPSVILGVAAQDASNGASDGLYEDSVFLAHPTNVFAGNMRASGSDHVIAQAHLGTAYGIKRDTSNSKTDIDYDVTGANNRVFVHGLARGSAIGDTNARVLFTFLPSFVQFLGTS